MCLERAKSVASRRAVDLTWLDQLVDESIELEEEAEAKAEPYQRLVAVPRRRRSRLQVVVIDGRGALVLRLNCPRNPMQLSIRTRSLKRWLGWVWP